MIRCLVPGQRRGYREQQGRDEGVRHHGPRGQGVCGPVAEDRQQRQLHRLNRSTTQSLLRPDTINISKHKHKQTSLHFLFLSISHCNGMATMSIQRLYLHLPGPGPGVPTDLVFLTKPTLTTE